MRRHRCCSRFRFSSSAFAFAAVPPPLAPAATAAASAAAPRNQARPSLHRQLRPPAPQGLPRGLDRLLVGRGRGDPRSGPRDEYESVRRDSDKSGSSSSSSLSRLFSSSSLEDQDRRLTPSTAQREHARGRRQQFMPLELLVPSSQRQLLPVGGSAGRRGRHRGDGDGRGRGLGQRLFGEDASPCKAGQGSREDVEELAPRVGAVSYGEQDSCGSGSSSAGGGRRFSPPLASTGISPASQATHSRSCFSLTPPRLLTTLTPPSTK